MFKINMIWLFISINAFSMQKTEEHGFFQYCPDEIIKKILNFCLENHEIETIKNISLINHEIYRINIDENKRDDILYSINKTIESNDHWNIFQKAMEIKLQLKEKEIALISNICAKKFLYLPNHNGLIILGVFGHLLPDKERHNLYIFLDDSSQLDDAVKSLLSNNCDEIIKQYDLAIEHKDINASKSLLLSYFDHFANTDCENDPSLTEVIHRFQTLHLQCNSQEQEELIPFFDMLIRAYFDLIIDHTSFTF